MEDKPLIVYDPHQNIDEGVKPYAINISKHLKKYKLNKNIVKLQ